MTSIVIIFEIILCKLIKSISMYNRISLIIKPKIPTEKKDANLIKSLSVTLKFKYAFKKKLFVIPSVTDNTFAMR